MIKYLIGLQKQYTTIGNSINQLVLRERVLLLAALVVILFIIWMTLVNPLGNKISSVKNEESILKQKIASLQQQIDTTKKIAQEIQDAGTDKAASSLLVNNLVSRSTIISTVRTILNKYPDISLKTFTESPDRLFALSNDIKDKIDTPLYEKGVDFVFECTYASAYDFLKAIEDVKQQMVFWDNMHYICINYPSAEMGLRIYALSQDKDKDNQYETK